MLVGAVPIVSNPFSGTNNPVKQKNKTFQSLLGQDSVIQCPFTKDNRLN
jgi:hypothetical protein